MSLRIAVAVLIVCGFAANAGAEQLFNQGPLSDLSSEDGVRTAVGDAYGADDFTPTNNWAVTGATFVGQWRYDPVNNPIGSTRPFLIDFYKDANGPAGQPIAEFPVSASVTLLGVFNGTTSFSAVYQLAVQFPATISFSSGTTYWFSATENIPFRNSVNSFYWATSPAGDGILAQNDLFSGWTVETDVAIHDLVFSLSGDVVPEPSAFFLAAFGAAIVLFSRRRNSQTQTAPPPDTGI